MFPMRSIWAIIPFLICPALSWDLVPLAGSGCPEGKGYGVCLGNIDGTLQAWGPQRGLLIPKYGQNCKSADHNPFGYRLSIWNSLDGKGLVWNPGVDIIQTVRAGIHTTCVIHWKHKVVKSGASSDKPLTEKLSENHWCCQVVLLSTFGLS